MTPDISPKWYKFDDGEVSECKMDDDEVCVCNKSINLQCTSILSQMLLATLLIIDSVVDSQA